MRLSSRQWMQVPLQLRETAQFSARVESVRFLAAVQDKLKKAIAQEQEIVRDGKRAYVDRSSFIGDMKQLAAGLGIETTSEPYKGTIRDIHSAQRLGLIYDQMMRSARGFARWKMDMDPDVLGEVPAYRFTRTIHREELREDWRPRWNRAGELVGWAGALRAPDVEGEVEFGNRRAREGDRFSGVLIDFDHFSLDSGKSSEAAGWIENMEARESGVWGQIRWTDKGEAAVKGGNYRFISPVWWENACEKLEDGRLRPLEIGRAAVTDGNVARYGRKPPYQWRSPSPLRPLPVSRPSRY